MTSAIDVTVPVYGTPETASVRANFAVASNEITALQSAMAAAQGSITTLQGQVAALQATTTGAPFLPTGGGTMTGPFKVTAGAPAVCITQNPMGPPTDWVSSTSYALVVAGGDGVPAGVLIDAYGGQSMALFRRADGSSTNPQATAFPGNIMCLDAVGRGGTAYQLAARINVQTAEAWTDAAHGTKMYFNTTAIGTTNMLPRLLIDNDGTVTVPAGVAISTDRVQVNNGLRADSIRLGNLATGPTLTSGAGAPTSTQPVGSLFLRTDGTAGNRLYVNQAGTTTWLAVAGV